MTRRTPIILAVVGAAVVAAPALAGAEKHATGAKATAAASGPKKTADLGDNYFAPGKLTVKKGTTIVWKWDNTQDVHDVVLRGKPSGVKTFESGPVSGDYSFKRKLTKPGVYKFVCSFHEEEMHMQVRVKKGS